MRSSVSRYLGLGPAFAALFIVVALLSTGTHAFAQPEAPTLSILRLESSLEEQGRADLVSRTLTELLDQLTDVVVSDRTDIMMGDLLLIHECDNEDLSCLNAIAVEFGTQQVLWGKVEPFGEDIMVTLRVYDSVSNTLRPVYSRKIPVAELGDTLRSDLSDLLSGNLWELPAYVSVSVAVPAVATVSIDGAPKGEAPILRARVQPGSRVIRVQAANHDSLEETHDLKSGQSLELNDVRLVPGPNAGKEIVISKKEDPQIKETPLPEEEVPVDDSSYRAPVSGWVTLGLGGAALIGGTITAIMVSQTQADFEEETRQRQADRLKKKGEDLALTTNILFGVGAAALVTSGLMFVFLGEYDTASDSEDAVRLDVAPLQGGGYLELQVRF